MCWKKERKKRKKERRGVKKKGMNQERNKQRKTDKQHSQVKGHPQLQSLLLALPIWSSTADMLLSLTFSCNCSFVFSQFPQKWWNLSLLTIQNVICVSASAVSGYELNNRRCCKGWTGMYSQTAPFTAPQTVFNTVSLWFCEREWKGRNKTASCLTRNDETTANHDIGWILFSLKKKKTSGQNEES